MTKVTLRQGAVTAHLSNVEYHPAEGFEEDNTWYATDEVISAESNKVLTAGPATLLYGETLFPVSVKVIKPHVIEIGYTEGLPKLALALGLLEHLTPKQQRAISGESRKSQEN